MIEFIKSNKLLMFVIVLVAGGFLAYQTFFLSGGSAPLLSSTSGGGVVPASQDLLAVLSNLRTIRLDNSIFTSATFESLSDFGVSISPEPAGRDNPFAPYQALSASAAASTTPVATPRLLTLPLGAKK